VLFSANYGSASQPNLSHIAPVQHRPAPPDQVAVGNNIQAEDREQWHLLTQTSGPVYTRIPAASQNKASQVYSTLLNKANKNNDEPAWKKLFDFARSGLGSSKRGGKKHTSQATLINKRLDAFVSGSVVAEPPLKKTTKAKSSKPSQPILASRVSAKLGMGDVRGAVMVVTSRESILCPSQETKALLQAKNPPRKRSNNTRARQLRISMVTYPIFGSPKRTLDWEFVLSKKVPQMVRMVFAQTPPRHDWPSLR
jgi:hypothetical protein